MAVYWGDEMTKGPVSSWTVQIVFSKGNGSRTVIEASGEDRVYREVSLLV